MPFLSIGIINYNENLVTHSTSLTSALSLLSRALPMTLDLPSHLHAIPGLSESIILSNFYILPMTFVGTLPHRAMTVPPFKHAFKSKAFVDTIAFTSVSATVISFSPPNFTSVPGSYMVSARYLSPRSDQYA